jgi:hypothetical protein
LQCHDDEFVGAIRQRSGVKFLVGGIRLVLIPGDSMQVTACMEGSLAARCSTEERHPDRHAKVSGDLDVFSYFARRIMSTSLLGADRTILRKPLVPSPARISMY